MLAHTHTIRVGPGRTPRTIMITARTQNREPLTWEPGSSGQLIVPTTGQQPTIVVFEVTHDSDPGTFLTVPDFSFQGNHIPNKNHNIAFRAGEINTLPAVAFLGQISKNMSPDDIRKFIGAGSSMEMCLVWSTVRQQPQQQQQQQPVYRGGGGGGLACFDASHIVPTMTHQTRPIALENELEYLVPIHLQSNHRTQQAAQDEAKRDMLACVDGVVPIIDDQPQPAFA